MRCAFSVDGELSVSTICFQTKCQNLLFKKSTIYINVLKGFGETWQIFSLSRRKKDN